MKEKIESIDTLRDIKSIMEKSSRLLSLSGWSGVFAGIAALVGGFTSLSQLRQLNKNNATEIIGRDSNTSSFAYLDFIVSNIFIIASCTLITAIIGAFYFTYRKSRKMKTPLWNAASRRMLEAFLVPLAVGGVVCIYLTINRFYGLVAPMCLLFYGLSLVNASKFTLGETKSLGYLMIVLGVFNLFWIGYGIYFWMFGFGILHILYGIIMSNKYDRNWAQS